MKKFSYNDLVKRAIEESPVSEDVLIKAKEYIRNKGWRINGKKLWDPVFGQFEIIFPPSGKGYVDINGGEKFTIGTTSSHYGITEAEEYLRQLQDAVDILKYLDSLGIPVEKRTH